MVAFCSVARYRASAAMQGYHSIAPAASLDSSGDKTSGVDHGVLSTRARESDAMRQGKIGAG